MELAELIEKINALTEKGNEAVAEAEAGSKSVEEVKALLNDEIKPEIDRLKAERADKEREEEMKAVKENLETLNGALETLRAPSEGFHIGNGSAPEGKSTESDDAPYEGGSFFADVAKAHRNVSAARERLAKPWEGKALDGMEMSEEGKAMTEGVAANGGYLVTPQMERQLVQQKELDNVLRGLCSKLNLNTNSIQLDQLTLSTEAGWVAELAPKPENTAMTLATVTANVFTAAGLVTVSNQLLADSNPAVDSLATADLSRRLVALEETAFLTGDGVGKPLGILNTPGVGATNITSTSVTAAGGLLDAVLESIMEVQTDWDQPTAILMHPRTWTRLIKDKDAEGVYTLDRTESVQQARPSGGTLFGVRVVLSNRIPTNLGGTTNESRIIVGDFRECLILDRQGITVDQSPHVYFTTNATVFRAEMRVGFTAARTPLAVNVIGGAGLAAG